MKIRRHEPRYRLSLAQSLVASVLLAGLVTLVALWCQPNSFRALIGFFLKTPVLIFLNAIPVGLMVWFFSFLFANVFRGAAWTNTVVGILSLVNRVKIQIRDEPLFPRDFSLMKEAASAVSNYHIDYPVKQIAVVALVTVALSAAGRFLGSEPFPADRLRGWKGRVLGAAASFGILACLIVTVYRSGNFIADKLSATIHVSNPYRLSTVFNEAGFPYNFCHQFTTFLVEQPEGFHRDEAAGWETGEQPGQGAPVHVVLVMDEAFFDLTDADVFTYGPEDDPLPNLHALRQDPHAVAGRMVVPGLCGGTANTEFDVLTGIQSIALSPTTTSSFRVVHRDLDSLFRVFNSDGYRTSYFHPGNDWFYNRENVCKWLGAQETRFEDEMEDIERKGSGGWVTDAYMAGQIQREFEEAVANGELLFHQTTTIQNHMSYTADKYGKGYPFPPLQTSVTDLPEETRTMLEVYVEGMRDADSLLGSLVDYFSGREEPVVVAFWGDHLPYLGDNMKGYADLGLELATDKALQYSTPYVIWANDAAADALDWERAVESLDLPEDRQISAAFFGTMVLELTGRRDEDPWFSFLCDLRREVPIVHWGRRVGPDGQELDLDLPENAPVAEQIAKWRRWSYYKLKYQEFPE